MTEYFCIRIPPHPDDGGDAIERWYDRQGVEDFIQALQNGLDDD